MPGFRKEKSIGKKALDIQVENFKTGKKRRKQAFDKGAKNIDSVLDPMNNGGDAFA